MRNILKPKSNILASNQNNFLIFNNEEYQNKPYIQFNFLDEINENINGSLTFIDRESDGEVFNLTITGNIDNEITSSTFNTDGDLTSIKLSFYNSLLLSNTTIFSSVEYNDDNIICYLELFNEYLIINNTLNGVLFSSITGNYDTYSNNSSKYVLNYRNQDTTNNTVNFNFNTSKDVTVLDDSVSFNITSPFNDSISNNPYNVKIIGYKILDNKHTTPLEINNNYMILPTTLSENDEIFDYSDYFHKTQIGNKVKFLTRNTSERYYSLNSVIGLSLITDLSIDRVNNLNVRCYYYDNNNLYKNYVDNVLIEIKTSNDINKRVDFYVKPNFNSVDINEIDYISLSVYDEFRNIEITERIDFKLIKNKTFGNNNTDIFFINSIGGLDSFTFVDNTQNSVTSSITSNNTFNRNIDKPIINTFNQYKGVFNKEVEKIYTLISNNISIDVVNWLDELQKSKFVYLYDSNKNMSINPYITNKTIIVINEYQSEVIESNNKYNVTITYNFN